MLYIKQKRESITCGGFIPLRKKVAVFLFLLYFLYLYFLYLLYFSLSSISSKPPNFSLTLYFSLVSLSLPFSFLSPCFNRIDCKTRVSIYGWGSLFCSIWHSPLPVLYHILQHFFISARFFSYSSSLFDLSSKLWQQTFSINCSRSVSVQNYEFLPQVGMYITKQWR